MRQTKRATRYCRRLNAGPSRPIAGAGWVKWQRPRDNSSQQDVSLRRLCRIAETCSTLARRPMPDSKSSRRVIFSWNNVWAMTSKVYPSCESTFNLWSFLGERFYLCKRKWIYCTCLLNTRSSIGASIRSRESQQEITEYTHSPIIWSTWDSCFQVVKYWFLSCKCSSANIWNIQSHLTSFHQI